jgi:serine/threonine-protein kinase RsbW
MNKNYSKITVKSELSQINKVEAFVELICDHNDIYNNYYSNILVSITEAFTNAVVHGNNNDSSKFVEIEYRNTVSGLAFSVKDQGNGFDFESVKNPIEAETEEESQNGRGIFLMRSLSDTIRFLDNGSKIEMLFKTSSINKELSEKRIKTFKSYINSSQIKKSNIGE